MPKSKVSVDAAAPLALNEHGFNAQCELPYSLRAAHIRSAMKDFLSFLELINDSLVSKDIDPLESFLMPANFSSIVGEFMAAAIPRYCPTLTKNRYHNGHPDLIPVGVYTNDASLHADQGIEIKASRHISGWQGHNAEDVWLMVFVFSSSSPRDAINGEPFAPFHFVKVIGAQIAKSDWNFSGRSATSRRTITATVNGSGFKKMEANWIYRAKGGESPGKLPKKQRL
jgi:hypothetical protein